MSSKIEALLGFYPRVLKDVGVFDDSGDGLLSYSHEGRTKPVTISKKRLCLPTKDICREGDWDHRIAFHPLSEQINQGPSTVLNAFKNYITERLTQTIKVIAVSLMELAADHKRHKALTSKGSKFLKSLIDADEKTVDTLKKVMAEVSDKPEKRLVSIFLKNGGEGNALRTCDVSFPILDEANSEDTTVFFDVKMPRKTKDKALIVALLHYILGDDEARAAFSSPVSSTSAPYFHSLLLSFQKLAERLNDLIALHGPACQNLIGYQFELEWTETMENFDEFAKLNGIAVPTLPGNAGKENEEVHAKTSNKFEASAEAVGEIAKPVALDLPWEGESQFATPRREETEERHRSWRTRDREERREEPREERRRETTGGHRSLSDVLGRGRRDERDDRDRGRDSGRRTRW